MPGETEDKPSGWTVDTLHMHVQSQINDMRDMLDERQAAQKVAMETAFAAADKAVTSALLAAEKAVGKAESAAEKRFDAVNEFRAQLADQAGTFMPRSEAEAAINRSTERVQEIAGQLSIMITRAEVESATQRNNERFQELSDRVRDSSGRSIGINVAWLYALGAIAAVGTIVSLYFALRGG